MWILSALDQLIYNIPATRITTKHPAILWIRKHKALSNIEQQTQNNVTCNIYKARVTIFLIHKQKCFPTFLHLLEMNKYYLIIYLNSPFIIVLSSSKLSLCTTWRHSQPQHSDGCEWWLHSPATLPACRKAPGTQWTGECVGPNVSEEVKHLLSLPGIWPWFPGHPVCSLYGLHYLGSTHP
jgi:hypothetical protein